MATKYMVVANGTTKYWSDTSIWSTSSGGAGGSPAPTASDDVIIDENSIPVGGNATIFMGSSTAIKSLICSSFVGGDTSVHINISVINPNVLLTISGSLIMGNVQLWFNYSSSGILLNATTSGKYLTSRYAPINGTGTITIDGIGSTWNIAETFSTNLDLVINNGTINANDSVYCGNFSLASGGTFNLASGIGLTFTVSFSVDPAASWSMGVASSVGSSSYCSTFNGGNKTYTIVGLGGNPIIYGNNTIDNLVITNIIYSLSFNAGSTTIINNIDYTMLNLTKYKLPVGVNGIGTWTISKSSGSLNVDWFNLSNSVAVGGATFNAGANSIDGGGNTGWNFNVSIGSSLFFGADW
jgi:hypothetical protein